MRFGSNFGRAMPAPTSTSVPAALELRERRLLRPAVARALERDVERLVDEVVRHRGRHELVGHRRSRAPSFSHSARRLRVRLAHDDVVDAERLQRGDRQEADRAAAGDEPARARAAHRRARVMPCSATASGSVERGVLERQAVGDAQQLRRPRDRLVAARTRPASRSSSAPTRPRSTQSDGRPREAVLARPAPRRRARRRPGRRPPSRSTSAPTATTVPRELVALDHARLARPTRGGSAGRSRRCRSG